MSGFVYGADLAALGIPPPSETKRPAAAANCNGPQSDDESRNPQAENSDDLAALLGGSRSPLDWPVPISLFPNTTGVRARQKTMTLRTLAAEIVKPRQPLPVNATEAQIDAAKERLPMLKLATFNGTRSDAALDRIYGIEGDYDAGLVSAEEAQRRLSAAGIAAIVYTTPTHKPDKPRWRAVALLAEPVAPADRRAPTEQLNEALGGILARESFTPAQAWFYGALGSDPAPVVLISEGAPLTRRTAAAPAEQSTPVIDDDDDDYGAELRSLELERARDALHCVPSDPREDWQTAGMALHHASGGSDEAFAIWEAWSKSSPKYDARAQAKAWKSFGRWKGEPRRIGSLFALAKAHGWKASPLSTDAIDRLNQRHAVVAVRGRTLITTERDDGTIDFGTPRDLHAYYENDRVDVTEKKTEAVSALWMRHGRRRTYPDGVTFAPGGCDEGTLNLWRGWAVEPDPDASCARFLDHVRRVVCRGDAGHTAYVLGWLAHMVQRPSEKPGVALVLRGGKGAGKDTVADYLARMIGKRHVPTVAESDHVTGKFNARLEAALLLHVQEGTWAGDRKAEGNLKYMVTSERIEIERKGIDSINLPSVLRLFISANAEWVVPASADERRWAVFEVSDARRGDADYFAALRAEMHGKGPAALLHYLRTYDLSGFDVRAAPETEGLRNQKLASLKNVSAWWFETLSRGELPTDGLDEGDWGSRAESVIAKDALRSSYVEWMKGRRFEGDIADDARFGRQLRSLLPGLDERRPRVSGDRVRQYVLPPLPDCRAAFDQWIGSAAEWEES